ncbi:MAG: hypothetical protein ACIRZT_07290, partial [Ligilactobacillus ruminis]
GDFVLLSEPRGPNLEAAVEHFFNFGEFCSTFEVAHPEFGPASRQKEAFLPFFVYFWYRAPRFRRTAEIPPKQETLKLCLMPVNLHFNEF